jgi:hypothetical protein
MEESCSELLYAGLSGHLTGEMHENVNKNIHYQGLKFEVMIYQKRSKVQDYTRIFLTLSPSFPEPYLSCRLFHS